jgi:hypothetical protein
MDPYEKSAKLLLTALNVKVFGNEDAFCFTSNFQKIFN